MSKSRNEKFHRLFKCVPEEENLYNSKSFQFILGYKGMTTNDLQGGGD